MEKKRKRPLKLDSHDWDKLLDGKDVEEPAVLFVKLSTAATANNPKVSGTVDDCQAEKEAFLGHLSDRELDDKIRRVKSNIDKLGPILPDKGLKMRHSLQEMEDEKERRRRLRIEYVRLTWIFFLMYFLLENKTNILKLITRKRITFWRIRIKSRPSFGCREIGLRDGGIEFFVLGFWVTAKR